MPVTKKQKDLQAVLDKTRNTQDAGLIEARELIQIKDAASQQKVDTRLKELGYDRSLNKLNQQPAKQQNVQQRASQGSQSTTPQATQAARRGENFMQRIPEAAADVLDVVSSPLSQPTETIRGITEGDIFRGARAVRDSRERIASGEKGEAATVIANTIATTTAAIGTLLAGGGLLNAAKVAAAFKGTGAAAGLAAPSLATAGGGLAAIYGVDKFFYSPTELATWTAVDNIAGSLSFQASQLANSVTNNEQSYQEAQPQFEQMRKDIEDAKVLVRRQTSGNPKLYASAKVFAEAINTALENLERAETRAANYENVQANESERFNQIAIKNRIRELEQRIRDAPLFNTDANLVQQMEQELAQLQSQVVTPQGQ